MNRVQELNSRKSDLLLPHVLKKFEPLFENGIQPRLFLPSPEPSGIPILIWDWRGKQLQQKSPT